MTDSSDIAAKAREALDGITPGPWVRTQTIHGESAVAVKGYELTRPITNSVTGPHFATDPSDYGRANAEFVAAAPELVAGLLAALETAETERDEAKVEAAQMLQSRAEMADEAQALRDWRDGERRQNERAAAISAVTPCSCSAQRTRAEGAETKVRAVELALSNHPECDTYSPDDVVSCGWKRAVVDVRAALGGVS